MEHTKEEVFQLVQTNGPIIANEIKKKLEGSDGLMISVLLQQLRDSGKIKFSNTKLGSSSFAYTNEQTPKLEDLIQYLNEKEGRVALELKEQGIINSSTAEPLTRVALQAIKDFAIPITVKTGEGEITFYRYFLLPSEEAHQRIKNLHTKPKEETVEKQEEPEQEKPIEEEPKKEEEPEEVNEEPIEEKPEKEKKPKPVEKQARLRETPTSTFGEEIMNYFKQKNIEVHEFTETRKNSEIEAKIELPTAVGTITYYCKARSKKKSNDGDLASAILAAKKHLLPAMYLTTGTVTKKAKENKELGEITVVEIGNSNN